MKVELVSYTKSFINDISNIQELVAFCARVSNPSNQSNTQTSERLIKYLLKHKHWSPFEMANVCLEITTTRDIARQILRHRSFSFQEFSQRYADPTKDLSSSIREARLQDSKNRQNSIEIEDEKLQQEWTQKQEDVWKVCNGAYAWAIENGLAKEVSRSVLPEGLMESKLYMNGTVRSWIHYIETRTDPSTQKEHRMIAELCAQKIATVFPLIFELSKSI
tara:strand:- start:2052 stop:2711 length:660 start_codon:yes stop_codon:yes gene_type:complete